MAVVKKRNRKGQHHSYDKVISTILRSENKFNEVAKLKHRGDISQYKKYMKKIFALKDCTEHLCGVPFVRDYSEFCKVDIIAATKFESELYWHSSIVGLFSEEINCFVRLRNDLEVAFLRSDDNAAKRLLDEIVNRFGHSYWAIQSYISLYGHTQGFEKQKEYTNSILSEEIEPFFKTCIKRLSDKGNPSVSCKRYDSLIDTMTHELSSAGEIGFSDYVAFKLNFYGGKKLENMHIVLNGEADAPVIDRYQSFIRCCQYVLSANPTPKKVRAIAKGLEPLTQEVKDWPLYNILNFINGSCLNELIDLSINECVDLYTMGRYHECVDLCEEILGKSPDISFIYEIYIKSKIRIGESEIVFSKGSLLNRILSWMLGVIKGTDRSKECYEQLLKTVYTFSNCFFVGGLYYFLLKEGGHKDRSELKANKTLADLNSKCLNPRRIAHDRTITNRIDLKGHDVTTSFLESVYDKNLGNINCSDIESNRKIKYTARVYEKNGEYDKALECYFRILQKGDDIAKCESMVSIAECYRRMGRLADSMKFIVDSYFKKPNLVDRLPISGVIEEFEQSGNPVDDHRDLSRLIVYDLYVKNISADKLSRMADAYDDYIYENGIINPLEIVDMEEIPLREKLYFLKNICIPKIMDISEKYESNDDVLIERINVCERLIELDPTGSDSYSIEIDDLISQIIIEKTSSKITGGRIFVDIDGIKAGKHSEFIETYRHYEAISEDEVDRDEFIRYDDSGLKFTPRNSKDRALLGFFEDIRNEFAKNEFYGLDGNLSLEVRHGQLIIQLRVPLEKENLLTEKDLKGNYQKNKHWMDHYQIIREGILDKIDQALREFSSEIDDEIFKLQKEWFVVHLSEGNFDFSLSQDDFDRLKGIVGIATDYEDFVNGCFDILLEITENNLSKLRNKISNELPKSFDRIFDRLTEKTNSIKQGGLALDALEESIGAAKNRLKAAIDELPSWFYFSSKLECPDADISVPITISVDTFKKIYAHKNIDFEVTSSASLMIKGSIIHDIVRVFITIFENVVRHCKLTFMPTIGLSYWSEDVVLQFKVMNVVSKLVNIAEINTMLDDIKARLRGQTYSDLVNKEGRSGLYKIDKILKFSLGCEHNFDFYLTSDYIFVTEFGLEIEGVKP